MKKENFSIIFSSLTGNTKKLADTIHEMLPHDKCDYFGENDSRVPQSDLLYIGFWTDKGNADHKTLELLAKLKNKKIFLFGTAGFGGSDVYFKKILEQVRQSIDSSNVVIGEYMCQGKMPLSVRERYIKMKESPEHPANLDMLIKNFDCALSHPDGEDLERLKRLL
ncbi:flavodoxin family protein [Oscillospiraceae bacterium Marseille-Q3528]|nr:flavodoxin family protein [Oscillospiraceae bacterium Marseille-Q3528]